MRSSKPIRFLMTLAAGAGGLGLLTATPAWANPGAAATGPATVASPALILSIATGPPTTATKAKGSGYPASDPITVTFDSTTVATTTSSLTGAFTTPFTVPASATPGPHTVSAFGSGGVVASATFNVHTNWVSARFSPSGSGFNPYENVG